MKARKVKTILGLGVAACAVIVTWLRPWEAREPAYHWKPLSHWVMALGNYDRDEGGFHPPADADVVVALRAIGPAAVPFLLKWLSVPAEDFNDGIPLANPKPTLLSKARDLKEWLIPWHSSKPDPPSKENVVMVFRVLGLEVKSAIPELAKLANAAARFMLTNHPSTEYFRAYDQLHYSVQSLACLGHDAAPAMLMVATNLQGHEEFWDVIELIGDMGTNGASAASALVAWSRDKDPGIHDAAVMALIEMRKELEVVLPILLARLKDSNAVVRQGAAEALGDYGTEARPALPDLLKAMNDPDPETRQAIIDAIKKIDPTALKQR